MKPDCDGQRSITASKDQAAWEPRMMKAITAGRCLDTAGGGGGSGDSGDGGDGGRRGGKSRDKKRVPRESCLLFSLMFHRPSGAIIHTNPSTPRLQLDIGRWLGPPSGPLMFA